MAGQPRSWAENLSQCGMSRSLALFLLASCSLAHADRVQCYADVPLYVDVPLGANIYEACRRAYPASPSNADHLTCIRRARDDIDRVLAITRNTGVVDARRLRADGESISRCSTMLDAAISLQCSREGNCPPPERRPDESTPGKKR